MLIFGFFYFVVSVITAFLLLIWRAVVVFLLTGYQVAVNTNTYKFPLFVSVAIFAGGLAPIKNQEVIMTATDILWECGIFRTGEVLTAYLGATLARSWREVIPRFNDIVMYIRNLVADSITRISNISEPGTIAGVIEIFKSLRDILVGVYSIFINVPSLDIPYFTDSFNRISLLVSGMYTLITDVIISFAQVTFTSEDCQFCRFGNETIPDTCFLTTYSAPSITINCTLEGCHDFECSFTSQLAIFFNWVTLDLDETFWLELSDSLCCILSLWKRPVFFVIGIIEGCIDFNDLLFQLQEWGQDILNCWGALFDTLTYGQFDSIFSFLFEFILSVIGTVIDGVTDTVSCFGEDAVEQCFSDFPENCAFDNDGIPTAGLQTCFQELNACLSVIPLYEPITPTVFDISEYIATIIDSVVCTVVSLIQCAIDATSCDNLTSCIISLRDLTTCMTESLPWLSDFFNGISTFLEFVGDRIDELQALYDALVGVTDQTKDAIDSSLDVLDQIAGFFGKRSESSRHDSVKITIEKARALLNTTSIVRPRKIMHSYTMNFFLCVKAGLVDMVDGDRSLSCSAWNTTLCINNCLSDTQSCGTVYDKVQGPYLDPYLNDKYIKTKLRIPLSDTKCKDVLRLNTSLIDLYDWLIQRDYWLCMAKYGSHHISQGFEERSIPYSILKGITSHNYYVKSETWKNSMQLLKKGVKETVQKSKYWELTSNFFTGYKHVKTSEVKVYNLYSDYISSMINLYTETPQRYPRRGGLSKIKSRGTDIIKSIKGNWNVTNSTREGAFVTWNKFLDEFYHKGNMSELSTRINRAFYVMNLTYKIEYWPSYQYYSIAKKVFFEWDVANTLRFAKGEKKFLVSEGWVSPDRYKKVMDEHLLTHGTTESLINRALLLRNHTQVLTWFLIGFDLQSIVDGASLSFSVLKEIHQKATQRKLEKTIDQQFATTTNLNQEIYNLFDFFIRLFKGPANVIKDSVNSLISSIADFNYSGFLEDTVLDYVVGRLTCTWPLNVNGTGAYNPGCFPLLFEGVFDWFGYVPNWLFPLQVGWPSELILEGCPKTYTGNAGIITFELSDNCGLIPDLPLCPACDYCPRTYVTCEERNFRDFLDSILFILAWIPKALNILYSGGLTVLDVQIYGLPFVLVPVLFSSPLYLVVVIPLFYLIMWFIEGLFPVISTGFLVITFVVLIYLLFPSLFTNFQVINIFIFAILASWVPSLFIEYGHLDHSPVSWVKSTVDFMLKTPLFMWIPGLSIVSDRTRDFIYHNNEVPGVDEFCFVWTASNLGLAVGGGFSSYWILSFSAQLIMVVVLYLADIIKAFFGITSDTVSNDWQARTSTQIESLKAMGANLSQKLKSTGSTVVQIKNRLYREEDFDKKNQ